MEEQNREQEVREWTLMFYFASDNSLAASIVSQLKALKAAGYHQDVNVVAYFDPETFGTPAHIFDVNGFEKLKRGDSKIGFTANDPFVRDLMFDKLWSIEQDRNGQAIRDLIQKHVLKRPGKNLPESPLPKLPKPADAGNQADGSGTDSAAAPAGAPATTSNGDSDQSLSLKEFLLFCADQYRAKHYMLFILGHGLVVGDDIFLYDEHSASHSVTLKELGDALEKFKGEIKKQDEKAEFELVSFHSCSMSSLEVAFQLQGTANYMLASQGPAFVGSWPYTSILIRVFNDVDKGKLKNARRIEEMIKKIFHFVFHNSTDYVLAGYSFDLCLCDLNKTAVIEKAITDLAKALIDRLPASPDDVPAKQMMMACILLAHWKSQSFWSENYTDLYDFCSCLYKYCELFSAATKDTDTYHDIHEACKKVVEILGNKTDSPIILAQFAGPESQYSHGFSLFFPWTRPTADRTIITEYEGYEFNRTKWFDFLKEYWGNKEAGRPLSGSMRDSFHEERPIVASPTARVAGPRKDRYALIEDIASLMFNADGPLSTGGTLSDPDPDPGKINPKDRTGEGCTCGSIKNYNRDTRKRAVRSQKAAEQFPASPQALVQKSKPRSR